MEVPNFLDGELCSCRGVEHLAIVFDNSAGSCYSASTAKFREIGEFAV